MRHRRQAPRAERETSPLRPLYLPVYGPTLVYSIGSGALQPVLVLAALSIGFSSASSSAVVGMFGLVGVVAANDRHMRDAVVLFHVLLQLKEALFPSGN